jgi:hypothetical protein
MSVAEGATGVALLIAPSLVGRLLLGAELAGASIPVARVTGIALIALRELLAPHGAGQAGAGLGWHVDLQPARHSLSSVSWRSRRMGRAAAV